MAWTDYHETPTYNLTALTPVEARTIFADYLQLSGLLKHGKFMESTPHEGHYAMKYTRLGQLLRTIETYASAASGTIHLTPESMRNDHLPILDRFQETINDSITSGDTQRMAHARFLLQAVGKHLKCDQELSSRQSRGPHTDALLNDVGAKAISPVRS